MRAIPRILIVSTPQTAETVNQAILKAAGCIVSSASQPEVVETWLKDNPTEAVLILAQPSPRNGLSYSAELLSTHPNLPIILVTHEINQAFLKKALEIGLIDYLTTPVDETALLGALDHSLARLNVLQEKDSFAQVLDGLEEGVILTDPEGHLLLVNRSARDIFALEAIQYDGKLVGEVINHPDLIECLKPQNAFPHRREISLDNGTVFNSQASVIPEIGIAVVMQDVTHLKDLDRVKTDFVNTITHDLRSPLTAIYGFVGLIDRVGPVNEQQGEFIHHIQTSVHHITSLVNDLMDLGHLEAGYDIQMEDVNLKDIISHSLENLDYQINAKMQELVLTSPDEVPLILGNPLHLQRMLTNLIDNAIKFTPPFGKIRVQCRIETNQLIFEVSDNGPGIPLEEQPHIFDKFYRGSNLARDIPGTGLGLSIVKSIVDKHHGRIWLESSPMGTTFTVILPVK